VKIAEVKRLISGLVLENLMQQFINNLFDRLPIFDGVALFFHKRIIRRRILNYYKTCDIHPTVVLGDVILDKNVSIGEGTYINSGQLFTGEKSKVEIGCCCAIGYNVHIKARSHNPLKPTRLSLDDVHLRKEADIIIGNYCWIGDNVFIGPGIHIGDHCIIGANSVVTHDVPSYTVVGGVPARLIRSQKPLE